MKLLYIIRGLPGSGKSTLANKLTDYVAEADNYHYINGVYQWKAENARAAHSKCQNQVEDWMIAELPNIAVANTFTRRWEYQIYIDLCEMYGYQYQVIELTSPFKTIHNVPEDHIDLMENRWEMHLPRRI